MNGQFLQILFVKIIDFLTKWLRYAFNEIDSLLPSIKFIINVELQKLIIEKIFVLSNKSHLEILHEIIVFMCATGVIISIYQKFFIWYYVGLIHFLQLWPLMLSIRMEIVFNDIFIKIFLDPISNVFWTSIFECKVIQADGPTRITIINVHQILLELLHGLGQQGSSCFVFLRLFFCALVVFSQTIV